MSRLAVTGTTAALALAALLDLLSATGTGQRPAMLCSFAVSVLGVSVVLSRRHLTPAALALAGASLLLTGVVRLVGAVPGTWGVLETLTLTLLLGVASRHCAGRLDGAALAALVAALVAAPWRLDDGDALTFSLLVALVAVGVLAVGLLRRADDIRAAQAFLQVRNDERRDIARDLHDDVAHHVTGIVVAAQAAAVGAVTDPAAARTALGVIERTALEALESMRSLVSVLRVPGEQDAVLRASGRWPADLQELVDRFGRSTGLTTNLTVDAGPVPGAHQQAAQRVTQEALTNVRRHALGATRADVHVIQDRSALRVSVTDDGRAPSAGVDALSRSGGGFGLVGIRERAAAFGGSVAAGRQEPRGWRVDVTLPLPTRSATGTSR